MSLSVLDRFGRVIRVAWSEHELLWLKAAMTLPRATRYPAMRDISEMSGRGYSAVLAKAKGLRNLAQQAEDDARRIADRAIVFMPVSSLPGPSKAMLMAGRSIGRLPVREVA